MIPSVVKEPRMVSNGGDGGGKTNKKRKVLWSPEEDELLYARITRHSVSTWSSLGQLAGLHRSGKSCRLRWMNYLRPDLKKEPISKHEEETIVSLQKSLGNRWSVIAARMPGRTDNEIKNYWNSSIRKRQKNTNTKKGELSAAGAMALEPVPAPAREKQPAVPALLPVGDVDIAAAGNTLLTTTHKYNDAGLESELSEGGQDSQDGHHYNCAYMNMIHLLLVDDLFEYPPGDLLMDAWESELYGVNSGSSLG